MANFDRSKPHINVGTMGHVDHGKTTLTAVEQNELSNNDTDNKYVQKYNIYLWHICYTSFHIV